MPCAEPGFFSLFLPPPSASFRLVFSFVGFRFHHHQYLVESTQTTVAGAFGADTFGFGDWPSSRVVVVVVIEYQNVFAMYFVVSFSLSRYDSHRISFVFAVFRFDFAADCQRMTTKLAPQTTTAEKMEKTRCGDRQALIAINELRFICAEYCFWSSRHVQCPLSTVQWRRIFALIMPVARMQFPFGGFRANISELLTTTMHTSTEIERRSPSMVASKLQFPAWIEWTWSHIIAVTMELHEPLHRLQSHSLTSVSVCVCVMCIRRNDVHILSTRDVCLIESVAQMTDVCEYQFHHVCRTDTRARHDIVRIHSRSIKFDARMHPALVTLTHRPPPQTLSSSLRIGELWTSERYVTYLKNIIAHMEWSAVKPTHLMWFFLGIGWELDKCYVNKRRNAVRAFPLAADSRFAQWRRATFS